MTFCLPPPHPHTFLLSRNFNAAVSQWVDVDFTKMWRWNVQKEEIRLQKIMYLRNKLTSTLNVMLSCWWIFEFLPQGCYSWKMLSRPWLGYDNLENNMVFSVSMLWVDYECYDSICNHCSWRRVTNVYAKFPFSGVGGGFRQENNCYSLLKTSAY